MSSPQPCLLFVEHHIQSTAVALSGLVCVHVLLGPSRYPLLLWPGVLGPGAIRFPFSTCRCSQAEPGPPRAGLFRSAAQRAPAAPGRTKTVAGAVTGGAPLGRSGTTPCLSLARLAHAATVEQVTPQQNVSPACAGDNTCGGKVNGGWGATAVAVPGPWYAKRWECSGSSGASPLPPSELLRCCQPVPRARPASGQ